MPDQQLGRPLRFGFRGSDGFGIGEHGVADVHAAILCAAVPY
jgi:hypothetical protein